MARDLFTYTQVWADTADKDANNNARLKTAAGAAWTAYAVAADGSTSTPTIYGSRTGATTSSSGVTNSTGVIEFWAEPGEYKVTVTDPTGQNRFSAKDIYWNSQAIQPGNVSGDLVSNDGKVDLAAVAADVLRQTVPIGAVLDWFRPVNTIAVPSGFEICDGRSILSANHDFGTGSTVVLPDLRNTFIIGADTPSTPTDYRTTGGGRSSNLGGTYAGDGGAGTVGSSNTNGAAPGIRGGGGDHTDASHNHTVAAGSHTHTIPAHTHGVPSHTHSVPAHTHDFSGMSVDIGNHTHTIPAHQHNIPAHSHTIPVHSHVVSSGASLNTGNPSATPTATADTHNGHTHRVESPVGVNSQRLSIAHPNYGSAQPAFSSIVGDSAIFATTGVSSSSGLTNSVGTNAGGHERYLYTSESGGSHGHTITLFNTTHTHNVSFNINITSTTWTNNAAGQANSVNQTALTADPNTTALVTGSAGAATGSVSAGTTGNSSVLTSGGTAVTSDLSTVLTSGPSSTSTDTTSSSSVARVPRYYGLLKIMKVRRA